MRRFLLPAMLMVVTGIQPLSLSQKANMQPTQRVLQKKPSLSTSYIERQEACLAKTIYHEARSEGYKGMVMVGSTVMNRKKTSSLSVCAIVSRWYDGYNVATPMLDKESYSKALHISKGLIKGAIAPNTGATHFFNKKKLTRLPKWAYTFHKVGKYKQHTFYREEKI